MIQNRTVGKERLGFHSFAEMDIINACQYTYTRTRSEKKRLGSFFLCKIDFSKVAFIHQVFLNALFSLFCYYVSKVIMKNSIIEKSQAYRK